MKKIYLLAAFAFVFGKTSFAKHVDVQYAMQVAKNFYLQNSKNSNAQGINLTLAYQCYSDNTGGLASNTAYYIFNVGNNQGLVIVSGDDLVQPILAYNTSGKYTPENHSPAYTWWMNKYKLQIEYAIAHAGKAKDGVAQQWNNYYNNIADHTKSQRSTQAVGPLCQTTWDQRPFYNNMCPYDNTAGANCVTGCVATAMAQIMKFWNYPPQGTGFNSYNCQNYGTLSANFGNTTYNWGSMPNSISSDNTDVETLMFHSGVSVNMNYGVNESTAWVVNSTAEANGGPCAQLAYTTYFGYNANTIQGLERANYPNDQDWINLLVNDLNANHVIELDGSGGGGGHTWVCDGYDINTMFHMNWGWGGNDNNYSINSLSPVNPGTGGGDGDFNSNEGAIIGIVPITGGGTVAADSLQLYSSITVAPNPIPFYQSFTVNADVVNNGSANFNGDYCAALFDSTGTFINYIGYILSTNGQPLGPGQHYNGGITFSDTNTLSPNVPGQYIIGIYYRASGDSIWRMAGNSNYTDPIYVNITGPVDPNNIDVYSNISPSPAIFTQSQSASVSVNLYNAGATTYVGTYGAVLLDLAGNFVQTIGTYTENSGLPAGYSYTTAITFGPATITATPGTYILAMGDKVSGGTYWYYCGGAYHTNPIYVNVMGAPLSPDQYEPDNTVQTAHVFPVNFTGNTAQVVTSGANIHVGTDYDYYEINLPGGNNYSVVATLLDNRNSSFTDAAVCSFSTDGGGTWSDAFNGGSGPIFIPGGGNVLFFVSDYFLGTTGTYELTLDVTSGANVGINDLKTGEIKVFPNPANDLLSIDAGDLMGNYKMQIFNGLGQVVAQSSGQLAGQLIQTDVSKFETGIYVVQLKTETGIANSKFIVR